MTVKEWTEQDAQDVAIKIAKAAKADVGPGDPYLGFKRFVGRAFKDGNEENYPRNADGSFKDDLSHRTPKGVTRDFSDYLQTDDEEEFEDWMKVKSADGYSIKYKDSNNPSELKESNPESSEESSNEGWGTSDIEILNHAYDEVPPLKELNDKTKYGSYEVQGWTGYTSGEYPPDGKFDFYQSLGDDDRYWWKKDPGDDWTLKSDKKYAARAIKPGIEPEYFYTDSKSELKDWTMEKLVDDYTIIRCKNTQTGEFKDYSPIKTESLEEAWEGWDEPGVYRCNDCGQSFDYPKKTRGYVGDYGSIPAYETYYVCPHCGSEDYTEMGTDIWGQYGDFNESIGGYKRCSIDLIPEAPKKKGKKKMIPINNFEFESIDLDEGTEHKFLTVLGATLPEVQDVEGLSKDILDIGESWWTKTPSDTFRNNVYIYEHQFGEFKDFGLISEYYSVRPLLLISGLDSSRFGLKIGDSFDFGGEEFEIISEDKAFCRGSITEFPYGIYHEDHDDVEYEHSMVKRRIDSWFNKYIDKFNKEYSGQTNSNDAPEENVGEELVNDWYEESVDLEEDTVKNSDGTWSNIKGGKRRKKDKTKPKFKTKKAADDQRKAMFANGYKAESLDEELCEDWYTEFLTEAFEKVDQNEYARQLIDGGAKVVTAEKSGKVLARPAKDGEEIEVWTKNGNFEGRETANEGEYILTRADDDGKPVVDSNGHTNSWKISKDKFESKYTADSKDGLYKPKGAPQKFVKTDKDVSFRASWGQDQNIKAGGYLNVTDPSDVYGIAEEEFGETYKIINESLTEGNKFNLNTYQSDEVPTKEDYKEILPGDVVTDKDEKIGGKVEYAYSLPEEDSKEKDDNMMPAAKNAPDRGDYVVVDTGGLGKETFPVEDVKPVETPLSESFEKSFEEEEAERAEKLEKAENEIYYNKYKNYYGIRGDYGLHFDTWQAAFDYMYPPKDSYQEDRVYLGDDGNYHIRDIDVGDDAPKFSTYEDADEWLHENVDIHPAIEAFYK